MTPRTVYALQFAAATLYALALAPLREWYEAAHLTIFTVVLGTLLALAPAEVLGYTRRTVLWGFVVSGAPIAVWQAGLIVGWW